MREGCRAADKNQKAAMKTKSVRKEKDCEARPHMDCERSEEKTKKHQYQHHKTKQYTYVVIS